MKVKCTSSLENEELIVGKEYEVTREGIYIYEIINEIGEVGSYNKDCFEVVEKRKSAEKEMVSHPSHYNMGKYEVIDVIDDWKLGFSLGNAIKYIARAGHKWNTIEDLNKAIFYIQHEIERLSKEEG